MRTRWALLALIVTVGLAGCGGDGDTAEPAATPTTPALTAYQRAYTAICDATAPTAPPTDAPQPDPEPPVITYAWNQGFCRGQSGIDTLLAMPRSPIQARALEAAMAGDAARQALVSVPPRCSRVAASRVARFCP